MGYTTNSRAFRMEVQNTFCWSMTIQYTLYNIKYTLYKHDAFNDMNNQYSAVLSILYKNK